MVRPYALTKGRTLPSGGAAFGLIDVVIATSGRPPEHFRPGPGAPADPEPVPPAHSRSST